MADTFGFGGDDTLDNGGAPVSKSQEPVSHDGVDTDSPDNLDNQPINDNPDNNGGGSGNNNDNKDNPDNGELTLSEGQIVEIGDASYTVDASGNLVDEQGNIFKEAKDVKDFLKDFEINNDNAEDELNIENIQKALGIELTGDDDKPIQFENTVEGVKSYVNSVIEAQKKEIVEGAINTLFGKYPILNDVLNYYVANGNSLEGFGDVPDRSNIVIDDANEAQQENIIRTAWKERKMTGDVEAYINYLKASNILASTARNELKALQDGDAQRKKDYETKAQEMENARVESIREYWAGVNDVISKRKIAGYEIPEQILITRDGKKLTATPKDFYHYLYDVDKEGKSAYARDFAKLTPEQKRDDEILRAYLTFVGGNYSNLVDLAIKEKEVKSLKLRAKEAPKTGVRVKTPANKKGNLDFGF